MKGEKFKAVFEGLGFKNVHPVIASGNIIFDSPSRNERALEEKIEKELPKKLGFARSVIVRSKDDLERLVKKDPYRGVRDEKPNYLLVTFFKGRRPPLCSVIKLTAGATPDFMSRLDREYGKTITSRTWKTVGRILKKMEATAPATAKRPVA